MNDFVSEPDKESRRSVRVWLRTPKRQRARKRDGDRADRRQALELLLKDHSGYVWWQLLRGCSEKLRPPSARAGPQLDGLDLSHARSVCRIPALDGVRGDRGPASIARSPDLHQQRRGRDRTHGHIRGRRGLARLDAEGRRRDHRQGGVKQLQGKGNQIMST